VDVLVQGAITSATIALVALGFSLVYGVGGIVNLAHGSFFMIGAYSAYAAHDKGAPLLVAALVGVAAAMLAGVLLERLVIAPIRHQEVAVLIATLAVAILVQSGVQFFYGGLERQLPGFVDGRVSILGVDLRQTELLAGVMALVTIVVVLLVLTKSPAGRMVRAVAEDEEASVLVGVRPERVTLAVLAIGAGLAGLAGVLVAPYGVLTPTMWLLPLTQAFAIVILGGLGSIQGTVLASVVIGFLDRFVAFNVKDGGIKIGLVTVAVILATLVLRPQGLLGKVAR
jgi:branched-chain amino acid transport system permease protein